MYILILITRILVELEGFVIDHFCTVSLCVFIVLRPTQELFTFEDVTIAGEVMQKGLCSAYVQGLCAGSDLYHATPAITCSLGFFSLIRRAAHPVVSNDTQAKDQAILAQNLTM
jgi:hypothetical protein